MLQAISKIKEIKDHKKEDDQIKLIIKESIAEKSCGK